MMILGIAQHDLIQGDKQSAKGASWISGDTTVIPSLHPRWRRRHGWEINLSHIVILIKRMILVVSQIIPSWDLSETRKSKSTGRWQYYTRKNKWYAVELQMQCRLINEKRNAARTWVKESPNKIHRSKEASTKEAKEAVAWATKKTRKVTKTLPENFTGRKYWTWKESSLAYNITLEVPRTSNNL